MELMSPTDSLVDAQAKMQEYLENGVRLGWLLNRRAKQVEIYRPDSPTERLQHPNQLSGESVLPNFVLSLDGFWQ